MAGFVFLAGWDAGLTLLHIGESGTEFGFTLNLPVHFFYNKQ